MVLVAKMLLPMKRNPVNNLLLAVAVALLAACSNKRADVLPVAKLEAVLYDYHLTQVIVADLPSSQRYKKDLYFDYVYDKHGVTKAELDSSLVYYARNPKGLSEVYANLSKRIKDDIQRIADEDTPIKARTAVAVVGDSVDLWYDMPIVQMTTSPLANSRYSFFIPTDTNFKAGDRLAWNGRAIFLQGGVDSLHRYLHLNLVVRYMSDSIVCADTLLYASGDFSLKVSDDAMVKSVKGEAYLKSHNDKEQLLLVDPSLVRCRRIELTDSLRVDSIGNQ